MEPLERPAGTIARLLESEFEFAFELEDGRALLGSSALCIAKKTGCIR
jgi:hypothetical protein